MNKIMALLNQNEAQNAPPAYQPLNITESIAQEAELPSCDPESKERLRRFLLFCVTVEGDLRLYAALTSHGACRTGGSMLYQTYGNDAGKTRRGCTTA